MKWILLLLSSLSLIKARAEQGFVLSSIQYLDTEASTNCPFVAQIDRSGRFNFTLSCRATSSNNVEVAFGCDNNANGVLDLDEVERVVGWDCGYWFTRKRADGSYVAETVCAVSEERTLSWEFWVGPQDNSRKLLVKADGIPIFEGLQFDSVFNPAWNMLRLTGRGLDASLQRFILSVKPCGTTIIMR